MSSTAFTASNTGNWNEFDGTWAQMQSATSASSNGSGARIYNYLRHYNPGEDSWTFRWGFCIFDTSSLPDTATISAAVLNVNIASFSARNFGAIGVAASTEVVAGDDVNKGAYTATLIGTSANPSTTGHLNIDITTTAISLTDKTRFKVGPSNIMSEISPGTGSAFNTSDSWEISGLNDGEASKPTLTITYTTPPAVTTGSVTNLQPQTATLGGNITDAGGGTVSTAGVCWALTANPTTSSSKTATATTSGAYTVAATSLLPGTLYYYRAYVTTENSTTYGSDATFRTPSGAAIFFMEN